MNRTLQAAAAAMLMSGAALTAAATGQERPSCDAPAKTAQSAHLPAPGSGTLAAESAVAARDETKERAAGEALRDRWSSKALTEMSLDKPSQFAGEMSKLSRENVFGKLWGREGLTTCERSLVTISILIALRAQDEMRVHFPIAIQNGCTIRQIEEAIYQSTAYAGFPAANLARRTAIEALRAEKLID